MHTYAILQNPGHNRVYYKQSQKLSLAELKIAGGRFNSKCDEMKIIDIAGISYITFIVEDKLTDRDLILLSRLSFVFAIYEIIEAGDEKHLVPVKKNEYEYIDSKINTILKYPGKTNELFTKMMINVALLASDYDYDDKINLLDPIAGKCTTLFEGTVYGYNTFGIEIEKKSVHDAVLFFKKFLETERIKHTAAEQKITGNDKTNPNFIHRFEYAKTKAEYKSEEDSKKLTIAGGNSINANRFFKKNMFHLIVGDLPYGVAHGNVSNKKHLSLTRNPSELLNASISEWYKVLKQGGALVLAWNKFVLPKNDIINILQDNGLQVLTESPYDEFEHKVDMSIKRDIIVAKKL